MSDLSKNDIAWVKLFNKYSIVNKVEELGFCEISAKEIKEFREPRLMTKFDYSSQLPKLFKENKLSILPLTRGTYVISKFEAYKKFETTNPHIEKFNFPAHLESIDFNNITSESTALNCAFVSGILNDFIGEEVKPTVNGRMSSTNFSFLIKSHNGEFNVDILNSQIEIDGGYEGFESLNLVEAKNSISKDFLIRQLYYPFRLWDKKVNKKVNSIFLTYTNGIFHFREYTFLDSNYYNSLELTREKRYSIDEISLNLEVINKILNEIKEFKNEPQIPFPQANSFERIINILELLNDQGIVDKEYITSNYDFDSRQTNYYTDALRYLGLLEKIKNGNEVFYTLSKNGYELFKMSIVDRNIQFIKLILEHKAFNKTLKLYFEKASVPSKEEVVEIMKDSNLYNVVEDSTYFRRSSTILKWIEWILDQIEE